MRGNRDCRVGPTIITPYSTSNGADIKTIVIPKLKTIEKHTQKMLLPMLRTRIPAKKLEENAKNSR